MKVAMLTFGERVAGTIEDVLVALLRGDLTSDALEVKAEEPTTK